MVDVNQAVMIPAPPRMPEKPDTQYFGELNRWLISLAQFLGDAHYVRATGLFFPDGSLPTTGYNLKPGEVFSNDGVLTVVQDGDIWMGPLSATTGLGTLTVTP